MNKKLKSLILSGVLVGSMVSAPIFANNNGEQGPILTTEITEVPKEEALSKEEVPSEDRPSDDEILETDDSETTHTEYETPPDTIEPVEKVEAEKETVDYPDEDKELEEPQTEGYLDDKGPSLYSYYVPTDMPRLEINNGYRGEFWVNENIASSGYPHYGNYDRSEGIPQGQYVDHIDVRTDKASITVKYYENGVLKESKDEDATVTHVSGIVVTLKDGSEIKYTNEKPREDGVVGEEEFNFQIVNHPGTGRDKEIYDYTYWLDLNQVEKITIIATLTVHGKSGDINYDNVSIVINGLNNIVTTSLCTNASGLDYHLTGDVSKNIIVEIQKPEELDITLTPETGDIPVYGDLYYLVFAVAILVAINKKIIKN